MKTVFAEKISIRSRLPRNSAQILMELMKETTDGAGGMIAGFQDVISDIEDQLKPYYVYKCRCGECEITMEVSYEAKMTDAEFKTEFKKKFGTFPLCKSCFDSEDFK